MLCTYEVIGSSPIVSIINKQKKKCYKFKKIKILIYKTLTYLKKKI